MQQAYSYRNAFHALTSITSQQGVAGLMKGYWATNSVWLPWNMIYIACYEKSKQTLTQNLQARCPLLCRCHRQHNNIHSVPAAFWVHSCLVPWDMIHLVREFKQSLTQSLQARCSLWLSLFIMLVYHAVHHAVQLNLTETLA